jgi:hypothetical protein
MDRAEGAVAEAMLVVDRMFLVAQLVALDLVDTLVVKTQDSHSC